MSGPRGRAAWATFGGAGPRVATRRRRGQSTSSRHRDCSRGKRDCSRGRPDAGIRREVRAQCHKKSVDLYRCESLSDHAHKSVRLHGPVAFLLA